MQIRPAGATLPDVTHHRVQLGGTALHYVAAGNRGSPILLVHGFPETWWAFHKLIPLLAAHHRVYAVDLRGFGDSDNASGEYGSAISAEDLHLLIERLGVGPVHLAGQDISGAVVFRLASTHREDVLSLTAVEMGLAGFGLEMLADVTTGGTWHIGVLAAPGIPQLLLTGREREFLGQFAFPAMSTVADAISDADIEEFRRSYARPDGWRGAAGLYQSMLEEGAEIRALAEARRLDVPVLTVDGGHGSLTFDTMSQVTSVEVVSAVLDGVGHYPAMEAPQELAHVMLDFVAGRDGQASVRSRV
jgi:pimeloyl-ACP methyl ester carboxylesterase